MSGISASSSISSLPIPTTLTVLPFQVNSSQSGQISPSSSANAVPQNAAATSINRGAIVGGVVGGLFGLALIAVALFIFLTARARRKRIPASAEFMYVPQARFVRLGTPSPVPGERSPRSDEPLFYSKNIDPV